MRKTLITKQTKPENLHLSQITHFKVGNVISSNIKFLWQTRVYNKLALLHCKKSRSTIINFPDKISNIPRCTTTNKRKHTHSFSFIQVYVTYSLNTPISCSTFLLCFAIITKTTTNRNSTEVTAVILLQDSTG